MDDLPTQFQGLERNRAPEIWPEIEERARLQASSVVSRSHPMLAAVALAVAFLVVGASLYALRGIGSRPRGPGSSPSPAPSATYTPLIGATIPVGPSGNTSAILYADGSVWVTASNVTGGGGRDRAMLFRIDPTKNLIVDSIPLAAVPSWETGGGGLASGDGSIWVIGANGSGAVLQRVDPGSDQVVATISLGGRFGADVSVDTSGVWAAVAGDHHAEVVRVDPATNQIQARIQLQSNYVRTIVAAGGDVLVEEYEWTNGNGPCGFVTAIDPSTNTVVGRTPVAPDCSTSGLWVWGAQIWATTPSGFVRMDPTTARPIGATTPYPTYGPRGFVAPGADMIWYAAYPGGGGNLPDTLAGFDPTTGVSQEYDVKTGEVGKTGAITASAAPDAIWMLNYDGSVTRINLSLG